MGDHAGILGAVVFIFFLRILRLLRAGLASYLGEIKLHFIASNVNYGSFDAIIPKLCTGLEAVLEVPKTALKSILLLGNGCKNRPKKFFWDL